MMCGCEIPDPTRVYCWIETVSLQIVVWIRDYIVHRRGHCSSSSHGCFPG
jgi:hypothetical protein